MWEICCPNVSLVSHCADLWIDCNDAPCDYTPNYASIKPLRTNPEHTRIWFVGNMFSVESDCPPYGNYPRGGMKAHLTLEVHQTMI